MPYVIIQRKPVFLPLARLQALGAAVGPDKNAAWHISSMIAGHKANIEKQQMIEQKLLRLHEQDPEAFATNWMYFDLRGDEAVRNVADLLFAYCHYHGHATLVDVRNLQGKLVDDTLGISTRYPGGRMLRLDCNVQPRASWTGHVRGMRGSTMSVTINSEDVVQLSGDLRSFVVRTTSFTLICGKDLHIEPSSAGSREANADQ